LHKHFEFRVTHVYLSHGQKTIAVNNPLNVGNNMYQLLIYCWVNEHHVLVYTWHIIQMYPKPTYCDKNINYLFIANNVIYDA
jgi:hypothetical protein